MRVLWRDVIHLGLKTGFLYLLRKKSHQLFSVCLKHSLHHIRTRAFQNMRQKAPKKCVCWKHTRKATWANHMKPCKNSTQLPRLVPTSLWLAELRGVRQDRLLPAQWQGSSLRLLNSEDYSTQRVETKLFYPIHAATESHEWRCSSEKYYLHTEDIPSTQSF